MAPAQNQTPSLAVPKAPVGSFLRRVDEDVVSDLLVGMDQQDQVISGQDGQDEPPTFPRNIHGLPSLPIKMPASQRSKRVKTSEDYEYKFGCSQNQAPRLTKSPKSPMFRQASVGEASVMESKTCKATRHSSAFWHAFMASKQPLRAHVSRLSGASARARR